MVSYLAGACNGGYVIGGCELYVRRLMAIWRVSGSYMVGDCGLFGGQLTATWFVNGGLLLSD